MSVDGLMLVRAVGGVGSVRSEHDEGECCVGGVEPESASKSEPNPVVDSFDPSGVRASSAAWFTPDPHNSENSCRGTHVAWMSCARDSSSPLTKTALYYSVGGSVPVGTVQVGPERNHVCPPSLLRYAASSRCRAL